MLFTSKDVRLKLLTAVAPLGCVRDIGVRKVADTEFHVVVDMEYSGVMGSFEYGVDVMYDSAESFARLVSWTYSMWSGIVYGEAMKLADRMERLQISR